MTAAAIVFKAVILGIGGKIRVPRAGRAALIILAAGISVGNQDCHRGAGGTALKDAADNPEGIRLLPGSGNTACGPSKGQLGSNERFVHGNPGSETVQDRTDFSSVAFTEERDGDGSAKSVFHNNSNTFNS